MLSFQSEDCKTAYIKCLNGNIELENIFLYHKFMTIILFTNEFISIVSIFEILFMNETNRNYVIKLLFISKR